MIINLLSSIYAYKCKDVFMEALLKFYDIISGPIVVIIPVLVSFIQAWSLQVCAFVRLMLVRLLLSSSLDICPHLVWLYVTKGSIAGNSMVMILLIYLFSI